MTATTSDRLAELWRECGMCAPDSELRLVSLLCEQAGHAAHDARVIPTIGENTIVAVPAAGLVARISDLVSCRRLEQEVLAAGFLDSCDVPVVEPAENSPTRQLAIFGDRVLTWWRYVEGEPADLPQLGAALRRLHRAPLPRPELRYLTLPRLDPFARLYRQLRAAANIPHGDLRVLHRHIEDLKGRWADSPLTRKPGVVLHGDAYPANTVVESGRVLLMDLEDVALGPAAYDLRPVLAFHRLGWRSDPELNGFLDAYGQEIPEPEAELLVELRLAQMTAFYAAATDRYPHAVDQVRLRIASLTDPGLYAGWWHDWQPEASP